MEPEHSRYHNNEHCQDIVTDPKMKTKKNMKNICSLDILILKTFG